ncbi:RDD family protein [Saliphagus infecundisoli]|uniref:RDD family protein n=1 Tax=Saliphagus infecundisoli TaxID=1849069 RepID=A0ABD5QCT1_9EURY|nr:RDD family protein [Saliphagus infecundisoli]
MDGTDDSTQCGVGIRGVAMAIDTVVWFLLFIAAITLVGLIAGQSETSANGVNTELGGSLALVALVLWLGLSVGYHTLLEWRFGKTIGKYLVRVRVTASDGSAPSLRASFVRNVLRLVDWLPAFYLVGIGALVLSEQPTRLGDRLGNTRVVRP